MGKESKEMEIMCLNFLIDCYFGQSKDLLKAAIDRAYADMAMHTLKFNDKSDKKWECRYKASEIIKNRLIGYNTSETFDTWREKTLNEIENEYKIPNVKIARGQAEKWLDMTIKYLFVFKTVFGEDDNRFNKIKTFLQSTGEKDYKPPIDSYILKEIGEKGTWSKNNPKAIESIRSKLGAEKDFLWELEMWSQLAEKHRTDDSNSYQKYYNAQKQRESMEA